MPLRAKWSDGLAPIDFLAPAPSPGALPGTWPEGPFAVPAALADRHPDEQRLLLETVSELAAQVRAHQAWAKAKRLTRVAVARRAHTSESRLSAFESGAHWPEWDLPARLQVLRRLEAARAAAQARQPG